MLQLNPLFSDHMILQQGKPAAVFGCGEPGKTVIASLKDASGKTEAEGASEVSEDGTFLLTLPALSPGLDKTLVVTDGTETFFVSDAAVGEVWLAGGQSNMEYLMNADAERDQEIEGLKTRPEEVLRSIRFYDVPEISFEGAEEVFDFSNFGKWRTMSKEDLVYFSAVSYYFERKLYENLDVPVGVIGCNWGGSSASCWMPEETIREAGGEVWLREYEDGLTKIPDPEAAFELFKKTGGSRVADPAVPNPFDRILFPGFSHEEQLQAMKMMADAGAEGAMALIPQHPWRPCGLYELMLKKVIPYTLQGFIWYQGCSDEPHADIYNAMMSALIGKWRADFGGETLPFITVQLAPFGEWLGNFGNHYPAVRRAQEETADSVEKVYLVSMGDAGMYYDIHPKHKRKPGERAALLALKYVYGKDVICDAPRAKKMDYDGDTAVIRFRNGEGLHLAAPENGGLSPEEAEKAGFMEANAPKKMSPEENLVSLIRTVPEGKITAEIADDTLRISLAVDGKPVKPEKVEFAETPYYEINVVNAAGLPAYPFTL